MKETIEFRINEDEAHLLFGSNEGRVLGSGLTRRVELPSSDPRLPRMAELQEQLLARRSYLYSSWDIRRRYSAKELEAAELLRLVPTCFFEPVGEDCGTIYDTSAACSICGAGRRQVSDLVLDTAQIPKRADVPLTIAGEWVLSRRLADLLEREHVTGVELRPVRHRGNGGGRVTPDWLQPVIGPPGVGMVAPTHFGIDPVRDDLAGEYRCPLGHTAGLKILSEPYVDRRTWLSQDMVETEQLVGARLGLYLPKPLVLISQRFYRLLSENNMRGFRVEVAHLV
jgi:hypothetical protein